MSADRHDDVSGVVGRVGSSGPLGALGGLVLVVIAALGLREVASLVVPVLFGLLIALTVWPLVGSLERRGFRHALALASSILVVLALVLLGALTAALSVAQLAAEIPNYETQLTVALAGLGELLAQRGIHADPDAISAIISPEKVFAFVSPVASAVSGVGGDMMVLAFTMIYALAGGASFRTRAAAAFGDRHPLLLSVEKFGADVRRYLVVRAELGLFAAALSFVLLFVLGVPFPLLWGILTFVASFIPNIGGIIAIVPPTMLAYLHAGPEVAVMVVIGYTAINFAQDQLLQPVVMGSELNLSPLVLFVAVIVWAWILGPAGALLAVPLTVALAMVLDAFPSSRSFAALIRNDVEPAPGGSMNAAGDARAGDHTLNGSDTTPRPASEVRTSVPGPAVRPTWPRPRGRTPPSSARVAGDGSARTTTASPG